MIGRVFRRLWYRLRVYFGFSEGPPELVRDDFGLGGIIAGGGLGILVVAQVGVSSVTTGVAALVIGSVLGWVGVRIGRTLANRR